jgi:superfamily I DNA/RNA helicase
MKVTSIFGPPGTGKTRTLVDTVGKHTERVLMLSFSKAAAQETASRLPDGADVRASTIHSLLFNHFGLTRASMVDGKKLAEFGMAAGFPFKGSEAGSDEAQEGDDYATVIAYANNRCYDLYDAYDRFGQPGTRHRFEMFVKAYSNWKQTYGYMDFDDILLNYLTFNDTLKCPPVVALDEAQDCSPLQWRVIEKICRAGAEHVYVAGDDDQAIFEWNGADPHGMVHFTEQMGGEFKVLGQSYRVPRSVLEFVNKSIIPQFVNRYKKEFAPADREGRFVRYGDIFDVNFDRLGGAKGGAMILARDRFRIDEIKRALNREMVPYRVLGSISPWTNRTANELREGKKPEIPIHWHEFYRQAIKGGHLNEPINLTLSTIHQAKGREAGTVVLDLQLSTRVLENLYKDRDAELRVMYVGLTRASDNLCLCGENPVV